MSKPRTIAEYPNRADDYDEAVSKSHVQNTDTVLDEGGDNEVTAEAIRDHVDSTDNPHSVTAGQVGAYTKSETDDLLDGKFDKAGGTIEGVTDIITPGASALVIQRTGVNAQSVRLRIIGTGNSGESPEATIDSLPDDDDIPLYVPGRISTGAGFYIGATRKDQDWDAKPDQIGGTWPMQVIGTDGGATAPFDADFYRIGDLVNVRGTVQVAVSHGLQGDFIISGLQYSGININQMGELRHGDNVVYPAGGTYTMVGISTAYPASLDMYFMGSGGYVRINQGSQSAATVWRFNITYTTNDPF